MDSFDCLNKKSVELLQRNNLLIPLIKSELQKKELSNVELSKELKKNALQAFLKKLKIPNQASFEEWKKKNNLSELEIENLALNEIKLKSYCKNKFATKAESRFLERKSQLDIVVYSLIRLRDSDKAREIYLRIEDKEADFGQLAAEFSEGMEKKTCGIIGPAPLGAAHPKLIQFLKNKPIGEVQPPIKIEDSYVIVRLESMDPAQLDDFMREKMTQELFNNWLDQKAIELCQKILQTSSIHNQALKE